MMSCGKGCVSAVVVLSVLAPGLAQGQATQEASRPRVLFDGKTLEGWKKTDFSGAGKVAVRSGVIELDTGNAMTGITSTLNDLPKLDYELAYEAMRREGGDFFAAATFPVGDSHITFINGGWGGSVTGLSSLDGADASENDSTTFFKYEDKTWYRFRVRVTAKKIVCWIDDKMVVNVDHSERRVGTRLETYANKPLGFATWETAGSLRAISVRTLSPDEVAETDRSEKP